jgi:hypothetical protein
MNNHLLLQTNYHKLKKTMKYDIWNPSSRLRQAQKCDNVKPVNGIPTLPSYCHIFGQWNMFKLSTGIYQEISVTSQSAEFELEGTCMM